MSYGIRTKNRKGFVTTDITTTLSRMRYFGSVAAGQTGSITLSDLSGKRTVEFALKNTKYFTIYNSHQVTRNGNVISWVPPAAGGTCSSFIFVFIY